MAYETEKNRLAQIITDTVGVSRLRDGDLEREATERAREARDQTGLSGTSPISHPSLSDRQARLGVSSNVNVAELATWNYLWNDPVKAAAEGLLNSTEHRNVLNNSLWKYWGIGIYTEMPPDQRDEIHRRWWFIIWLSDRAIGDAARAKPSEIIDPVKKVSFGVGTHYAYDFDYQGKILSTRSINLTRSSHAHTNGRGRIPGRAGVWLRMSNGTFAGLWVREESFVSSSPMKLT